MSASRVAYAGLAVVIVALMIYVHGAAGFTLPVPWGDEAYFVWQARAFERWNSFIAPELDPSRPLFLLPFVHGLTLGTVFKVVGYSLEVARAASLAFTIIGFALLAIMARRHAAPLAALALIGAFVLNVHFVTMANNARMEAYVFAVLCAALLLLQRERFWMAVAVLSVTPMIHPNGVFLLGPVLLYGFWSGDLRHSRPGRAEVAVFAIAALIWLGNGVYALSYWDGFKHETAMRFGETAEKHGGFSQFAGWHAAGLALIVATLFVARKVAPRAVYLSVFALGAWLWYRVRIEQWYDVFGDFAYLLVSLALIEIVAELVARAPSPRWIRWRVIAPTAAAIALLAIHYRNGRVEGPVNYLAELRVAGMMTAPRGAYFRPEDRDAVRRQMDALHPGCPVVIEVYPWGDGLLFADLAEERVRIQVPYFDPLFQPQERWAWGYGPTAAALPDLYIVRESRYQPQWLKPREQLFVRRAIQQSGVESATVFHSRDSTEIWYAIRPAQRRGDSRVADCSSDLPAGSDE